jgi:hypothetical protein
MKKTSTLFIAMMLSAGMAFAQSNDAISYSEGDDNTVSITQAGMSNESIVNQRGDNNEGITSQTGDGNFAEVLQNQYLLATNSYGSIVQVGDNNIAFTEMRRDDNSGDITQTGNDNWAQTTAYGGGNEGVINQIGDDNIADIQQGFDNEGSIYQSGSNNDGEVLQSGTVGNKGSQWVAGSGNTVEQVQTSDANSQRVELTGDDNTYTVTQEVGSGNMLYINSRGTGPGENTLGSDLSTFTATQSGSDNLVSGEMGGVGNSLTISQTGLSNAVGTGMWEADGFRIQGDGNVGSITQTGDYNVATMTMVGNDNTATITQSN